MSGYLLELSFELRTNHGVRKYYYCMVLQNVGKNPRNTTQFRRIFLVIISKYYQKVRDVTTSRIKTVSQFVAITNTVSTRTR